MKTRHLLLTIIPLCAYQHFAFADCATENPQGPDPVIKCAALDAGFSSAEEYWNKKLFSPIVLDQYCNKSSAPSDLNTPQTELYNLSCSREKGTYFSYSEFIAADAIMKAALGDHYNFMRNGSYAVNTAELSNFLATASQETTGNGLLPIKYQQDGLYFRSEYSYLGTDTCYVYPANPGWTAKASKTKGSNCGVTPLAQYYTNYYPYSTYSVAVDLENAANVYTKFVMDLDGQYNLNQQITVTFPGLPTLYSGGTYSPPSGTAWQYMNQLGKLGYWIGQGNLQLTGVAMTQFFGWYYQNLAEGAPVDFADYNAFVEDYVGNGKLAWLGGLWYWNVRIQGYNQPTLHTVLTGTKAACHDIGLTTYLINGGCNNAEQRVLYYKYYKSNVFKQSSEGVPYTYQGVTSDSMTCSLNLASYCTAP